MGSVPVSVMKRTNGIDQIVDTRGCYALHGIVKKSWVVCKGLWTTVLRNHASIIEPSTLKTRWERMMRVTTTSSCRKQWIVYFQKLFICYLHRSTTCVDGNTRVTHILAMQYNTIQCKHTTPTTTHTCSNPAFSTNPQSSPTHPLYPPPPSTLPHSLDSSQAHQKRYPPQSFPK